MNATSRAEVTSPRTGEVRHDTDSDADTMMDAWTEDYYQTPKKTKWRLGRSRSHEAS